MIGGGASRDSSSRVAGTCGPLAALLIAAALAPPASAHHSAAMFDTSKQVAIEGVVTKYDWRNPHVYMAIRTTDAGGAAVEQEIEAGASSVLLPLGLKPDSVAIGERVTVRGNPSKQGAGHIVLGRELVTADGSVLPLNIGSAASRAAPRDVTATSIAGTWLPRREQFFAFDGARGRWALTDKGHAAAAAFDGRQTAHADCIPVTAPSLMLYPVTSVVEVGNDVVKLHVDWMSSERVVYLDGRGRPANAAPSLHGHSIGHWEGGTLVVDTTQFADHKQGNSMTLPSGPRKHVVERFALTDDHKHLKYDVVLEDPDYLAAPVRYGAEWDYRPDLAASGLPCDLEVARRFLSQQ
ncbi:MAG TPA: DUF6152 family protein [Gammaproteobacteria bacterium]|nr:DUF6152 family protein [Gammaproteobacteria bacterium]